MYYPGIRQKIEKIYRQDYELWEKVIQKAKESGEIRSDTDVKKTAIMFRQMFLGLSYEQAFLNSLNVEELAENFRHIYSLLKMCIRDSPCIVRKGRIMMCLSYYVFT